MSPMKKTSIEIIVNSLNLPKHLCDHLVGEKHTERHRMISGSVVMFIGVAIVETSSGIHVIHFIASVFGGLIHAMGAIPFLEKLEKKVSERIRKDLDEVKEIEKIEEKEKEEV